jgi:hypothetical protein
MLITGSGQPLIAPRATFNELYSRPLSSPIQEKRLRIVADTCVRGTPIYTGSVLAFDTALPTFFEDFACLLSGAKAVRVSNETPLHLAPAPVAPPPLPAPAAEKNTGTMELARALVTALREASPQRASKA